MKENALDILEAWMEEALLLGDFLRYTHLQMSKRIILTAQRNSN